MCIRDRDWFRTGHEAASAEFIDQPTFDTCALYSVKGDVAKQPDLLPGENPRPGRECVVFIANTS